MKLEKELMNQKFKAATPVAALLALSVLVTACGLQTDPTKKYSDVRGYSGGQKTITNQHSWQTLVPAPNLEPKQNLVFPVGQKTTYTIETTAVEGIRYRWTAINKPDGLEFVETSAGVYELSWTPAKEIIIEGQAVADLTFDYKLEILSAAPHIPEAAIKEIQGKVYNEKVQASNVVAPSVSATKSADTVTVGGKLKVTITVEDNSQGADPTLNKVALVGGGSVIDLTERVKLTPLTKADGKFVFEAEVDTAGVQVPEGTNQAVGQFTVQAVSASGAPSIEMPISIKINREGAKQ